MPLLTTQSPRPQAPQRTDGAAGSAPRLGVSPSYPAPRLDLDGPKLPPIHRPERFERMSKPLEIDGDPAVPAAVFLGGLGTTGYTWMRTAYELHDRLAMGVSVNTLAGHEGGREGLRASCRNRWVTAIERTVERRGPSVGFGFSTGGLAMLDVALRRPELFRALVLVAPALQLRSTGHRIGLAIADGIASRFRPFDRFMRAKEFKFADFDEHTPDQVRRAPRANLVPGATFLELVRLQREVLGKLDALRMPAFLALADEDELVHERTESILAPHLAPGSKIRFYPGAHNIMLNGSSGKLFTDMTRWLADLVSYEGPRDRKGLPAHGKAHALLVREILELNTRQQGRLTTAGAAGRVPLDLDAPSG